MEELKLLLNAYREAPEIYQAGKYWKTYEDKIIRQIEEADINQLRSGKYPIFATFGFGEYVYMHTLKIPKYKKVISKLVRSVFNIKLQVVPYSVRIKDIREMAYRHCELLGELSGLKPISEIETTTFGNPQDLFEIKGKKYTMFFLSFYIRLCYFHQHSPLKGDEVIVELGSGSGHQIEVLKQVFPNLTILCFDLPYNLYLCYKFLSQALPTGQVKVPSAGLKVNDLNDIERGKVHMFGNWQFPMLKSFRFDIFWNAASFGEMEPHIVQNYIDQFSGSCETVYLLQARKGKESSGNVSVQTPITFEDYDKMLQGFELVDEADAYQAHRRMSQSGGYFQAIWKRKPSN